MREREELLRWSEILRWMSDTVRVFVKDNFLLTRHLREYLTLMLVLRRGMADHLFAA